MTQCSILIVSDDRRELADRKALQRAGFVVEETREWPADGEVTRFHIVLAEFSPVARACMIATRLRAKRGLGRRVLIGFVPAATAQERRCAIDAGFDAVLDASCTPRQQIATILHRLRLRPEFRCILPPRGRRAA